MVRQGIIVLVNGNSDWVKSLVTREKLNDSLRICLDFKDFNKAIKREHHPVQTLDDITSLTLCIHIVLQAGCQAGLQESQIG